MRYMFLQCSHLLSAGLASGGISVVTEGHCHAEASTQVAALEARNGPKGTAAENRADPSVSVVIAVAFTIKGSCWAASSIYSTGRAGRSASSRLPRGPKTVAYLGSNGDERDKQKRANSARAGRGRRSRIALIGLLSAGLASGGISVVTEGHCHAEASTQVAALEARNGPKGTAAENRASSDGSRCTNRTLGRM